MKNQHKYIVRFMCNGTRYRVNVMATSGERAIEGCKMRGYGTKIFKDAQAWSAVLA